MIPSGILPDGEKPDGQLFQIFYHTLCYDKIFLLRILWPYLHKVLEEETEESDAELPKIDHPSQVGSRVCLQ